MSKRFLLCILIQSCNASVVIAQYEYKPAMEITQADSLHFSFDDDLSEYDASYVHIAPPKDSVFKRGIQTCGNRIINWFFSFTHMISSRYNRFKNWIHTLHHKNTIENNEKAK